VNVGVEVAWGEGVKVYLPFRNSPASYECG